MFKNIRNIRNAVADLVSIGTKEVTYQASKASSATETVTNMLASKAATLKENYQESLEARKAGIKKAEVVKDVPPEVTIVN